FYHYLYEVCNVCFFFSSRRRHTRWPRDWSSDVCSSDLDGLRPLRVDLRRLHVDLDRAQRLLVDLEVGALLQPLEELAVVLLLRRSEERRVGKECRCRWSPYH